MGISSNGKQSSKRGIALIAVLWALSVLSLLAALVLAAGNLAYRNERNAQAQIKAEAFAEAGIARAVLAIVDTRAETRWPTDGSPQEFTFEGVAVAVSIQDELGKIDLNAADTKLLSALFRSAGVSSAEAEALAARIAAWRTRFAPGADDAEYGDAGYRPRHAPFQSVDELKLVAGMTPELFARVEPALTVHSRRPAVDTRVAPEAVRLALREMGGRETDDTSATSGSGSGSALAGRVFGGLGVGWGQYC
jgi:general secretion pathway protein K